MLLVAVLGAGALAPTAWADESPAPGGKKQQPKTPAALYGDADPTYDGVWRQSLALLAQHGAKAKPAPKAVAFLAEQQCDDGYFTAYRAKPNRACDAKEEPGDSNATALAVQALAAVGGQRARVELAVDWLRAQQNDDGGWAYNPGGATDANSTALVVGALHAAGEKPSKVRTDGANAQDALGTLQLGCDAPEEERGAFAYQPEKKGGLTANTAATTAAVLAAYGSGLLVDSPQHSAGAPEPLACSDGKPTKTAQETAKERATAGAAWLAAELRRNGGYLKSSLPGQGDQPDYTGTADAARALAAGGHTKAARQAVGWLRTHLGDWKKSTSDPAALGSALLASRAVGGDPERLGPATLNRLNATGPAPTTQQAESDGGGNSTVWTWSLILVGLAVGGGIGIWLSGRRNR